MNLLNDIRKAYSINKSLRGKTIVICYTFMRFFRIKMNNSFTWVVFSPIIILYKFITDFLLGVEIPASVVIGRGLIIHHGRGLVLNPNVLIGENVTLQHTTTIGNKVSPDGKDLGSPVIEDNVTVGPHSVIIGKITIGKNSIIGAGSVVVKDVEPNSVVAGNPARFIRKL